MFSRKQKFKNIFFVLLANVLVFSGFEWVAGYLIQEDNIYGNVGMMDGNHPLMEFDGDLGYQIRKQAMREEIHNFPLNIDKVQSVSIAGEPVRTRLSFTDKEGIIRSEYGDIVVNSLGYRGPYFKKKSRQILFESWQWEGLPQRGCTRMS